MRNQDISLLVDEADAINRSRELNFPHESLLQRPNLNAPSDIGGHNQTHVLIGIDAANLAVMLLLLFVVDQI